MEITLYILLFITNIVFLFITMFYKSDRDIQIIFAVPTFVISIVLAFLSFNIEIFTYEAAWQTKSIAEYAFALINFMFAIISGLNGFMLIMEKAKGVIQEAGTVG